MAAVPRAACACGIALAVLAGVPAAAGAAIVDMHRVSAKGTGASAGHVEILETKHGVVFAPDLSGLSPGLHGFHLHEQPDCGAAKKDGKMTAAAAAGGHYDPHGAGAHGLRWGDGHLGDLPALHVDAQGNARHPVLTPRLEARRSRGACPHDPRRRRQLRRPPRATRRRWQAHRLRRDRRGQPMTLRPSR